MPTMFRVFVIVLIVLSVVAAFDRVMDRWDRHLDLGREQQSEQVRPTIGLPQDVAIEIGRIDLNNVARTITLYLHVTFGDKYYYTELTLPTREVKYNEDN